MPRRRNETTYKCPKCGEEETPLLPATGFAHQCPKDGGKYVDFKEVK